MRSNNGQLQCLNLHISGSVQGIGFRPFVYRLAKELELKGWVNNNAQGVAIAVEGEQQQLDLFLERLQSEKPARSQIQQITQEWCEPVHYQTFEIHESTDNTSIKTAVILPDLATCDDCLRDIFDAQNRRYRYPFTNCTNCGTRYSIIKAVPYDRHNTTMHKFQMCADCQAEYDQPLDRRFHAQPNACPKCGPHLELWDRDGQVLAIREQALLEAVQAIREGNILAIKGLGGFQLVVDANNAEAITKLKSRKHRPHKPFALMYPNLESIHQDCQVSALEARLLNSTEAPIVLLQKLNKDLKSLVSDNSYIGVMLPYTPLHHLLMAELQSPIVATSGNLSDEPICIDNQEAIASLGNIADLFLVHNRDIAQPVDDSVVRVIGDRPVILRRARGYAPSPITKDPPQSPLKRGKKKILLPLQGGMGRIKPLLVADRRILALGGHLKNAIALSINNSIILSQHIGDLETTKAFEHFQRIIQRLSETYEFQPEVIACDAHPDYLSSQYARQLSQSLQIPIITVQHHYAHALACMVDNQIVAPVLGIAWDGTGYGTDGTIWGGEFLKINDSGFARVAHLQPFPLLGGDKAAKEPRRVALGILWEIFGDRLWDLQLSTLQSFTNSELRILKTLLTKPHHLPKTSSIGRLFDAVASLLNIYQITSFEGQAAIALEQICDPTIDEFYGMDVKNDGEIDWTNLIQSILEDIQNQTAIATIATKFHNSLVAVMVAIAKQIEIEKIVLTGGCFQNRYLTERAIQKLTQSGFQVYCHQNIPPNDGGIAAGQIMAALRELSH
ncbi:carbamoyltransferase HypF [Pseudanabaena yagii]|uniref:Carbamoyltransferase n=1 Tax=Pseudanabaena yagii GIHE-NHR1 TaxID=2722753 RepID=A0ABX1LSS9_9CYAN|nr:carbamoyltransferase HypF [Pseudanabaena yagii]NMF58396.1 carbamoyltransferase HypF [Pseudanabaena yagii GIHE-NHR1]